MLFASIAAAGCVADLWTKWLVFRWRGIPPSAKEIWWLWEGYVGIETARNPGALFGFGKGHTWLFALLSVVAIVGIVYCLIWKRASDDLLLTVTLGCITGGILGNLYDRLGMWSDPPIREVRDWIRLSYGDYFVWPNFNVADSLLVFGAGLLIWHSFRASRRSGLDAPKSRTSIV